VIFQKSPNCGFPKALFCDTGLVLQFKILASQYRWWAERSLSWRRNLVRRSALYRTLLFTPPTPSGRVSEGQETPDAENPAMGTKRTLLAKRRLTATCESERRPTETHFRIGALTTQRDCDRHVTVVAPDYRAATQIKLRVRRSGVCEPR
jgi:hypothetical protein